MIYRSFWRASLIAGWLAVFSPALAAADKPAISLRWITNSNPASVEVTGMDASTLKKLAEWQTPDWQKLLSVYAGQGDFLADMRVPAMLGSYQVEGGAIRFAPQFPLERGVTYRAIFRPAKLPGAEGSLKEVAARFELPKVERKPTTIVTKVYPTADVLPENLLKFYVHFSAPMQGGQIYEYIHLRNESGELVELPFLEIDEELWNPDMTRLTLFIDPGRIKRGVQPLEEIGPALEDGKRYTLEIDEAWHDHHGVPMREAFKKAFRVGPPEREPLSVATWKIKAAKAGTRETLVVDFPGPLDSALALRVIHVVDAKGKLVEGTSALSEYEKRWAFTPRAAWTAGQHQLQVQNTIEDLAGNNIGKSFEVDLFEGVQRRFTNSVVKLAFEVN